MNENPNFTSGRRLTPTPGTAIPVVPCLPTRPHRNAPAMARTRPAKPEPTDATHYVYMCARKILFHGGKQRETIRIIDNLLIVSV